MTTASIDKLDTDIKQFVFDEWGIQQQRKYSIFIADDWHVALHNLPLLRLRLKLSPNLHKGYNDMWSRVRAWALHSTFRSNICIKENFDAEDKKDNPGRIIYDLSTDIYSSEIVFCHELTHICTQHLRLPHWLEEGIAMLTVDKYFNLQTVSLSTLELLKQHPQHMLTSKIKWLEKPSATVIACQYAAGYWLSRYLHELHPDSFKYLLAKPRKEQEIKKHLTEVCGLDIQNLNATVLGYFHNETTI